MRASLPGPGGGPAKGFPARSGHDGLAGRVTEGDCPTPLQD